MELKDESVVFRSTIGNGSVIGERSLVVGSALKPGTVVPPRTVVSNGVKMEAQRVTAEGSGTSLRELKGRCLEVGVPRGQNKAEAGMVGREAQMAEAAALACRVRAVHDDSTVTPVSAPITCRTHEDTGLVLT